MPQDAWRDGLPPGSLETTVPGIFAAGDIRSGSMKRVAAALKQTGFDMVVAGNESTDGRGGVDRDVQVGCLGEQHLLQRGDQLHAELVGVATLDTRIG